MPSRYHVTIFVHSPASVGASSSPTSACSSVDFPAFTFPAMATRNGSSSRARSASSRAAYGESAYTEAPRASSPRTSSSNVGRLDTSALGAREAGIEGHHLVAQTPDAHELGLDVRQPLGAGLRVHLHRLLRLVQRLGRRSVQLLGPRRELVAQLALDAAHRVSGVLADLEGQLVGVLAMGVLRLRPPLPQGPVLPVS